MKKSDTRVRLQGKESGKKGKLAIYADIFAVTPSFLVVEVKKDDGNTLEYNQFCSKEFWPALKNIFWMSLARNTPPMLNSKQDFKRLKAWLFVRLIN